MAEREQGHRHEMDRSLVETDAKTRTRAQPFAFGIAVLALCVAAALGLTDHAWYGLGALLLGLGPITASFITGRSESAPELPPSEGDAPDEADAPAATD
jgi:uncharacterized membrane protein